VQQGKRWYHTLVASPFPKQARVDLSKTQVRRIPAEIFKRRPANPISQSTMAGGKIHLLTKLKYKFDFFLTPRHIGGLSNFLTE
jgi:hypothetical protein